jgi:hypothetical protein
MAMPMSLRPPRPGRVLSQGETIHATAASTPIQATRRSGVDIDPRARSSARTTSRAWATSGRWNGCVTRTSAHQVTGSSRSTQGRPNTIQSAKLTVTPYVCCMNATASALVGVPISVPRPPMVAEYATPSTIAVEKCCRSASACSWSGATSAAIETATGSIISVVEVFDTHMLTNAVAAMTPNTSPRALEPASVTMVYAMRRCRCQRSSAAPAAAAQDRVVDCRSRIGLFHRDDAEQRSRRQQQRPSPRSAALPSPTRRPSARQVQRCEPASRNQTARAQGINAKRPSPSQRPVRWVGVRGLGRIIRLRSGRSEGIMPLLPRREASVYKGNA